MRGGFKTEATAPAAQATRIDLVLETLALRHQLAVLARSHRRFRPPDRLVWLLLRWFGPGGGKRWCWFSQPPSVVGIAKEYVDAGAVARGVLDDRESIRRVEN